MCNSFLSKKDLDCLKRPEMIGLNNWSCKHTLSVVV
jgi:hypothetical protein